MGRRKRKPKIERYLCSFCRAITPALCEKFKLPIPASIKPLKRTDRAFKGNCGYCDNENNIRLRVFRYNSIIEFLDTFAHELAHLKHDKHSEKHYNLTLRILRMIKREFVDAKR